MTASLPAVVLAAGASRRLGEPKQLLTFGGETLLGRSVRLAIQAGAAPVFTVIGAHSEKVREALTPFEVIPVLNERWNEGIASSIQAGLQALIANESDASGVLILACDQPRLTAAHLHELVEAFSAQTEPSIVASRYAGVLGVPAVFPRIAFSHLFALQGDKGARSLLLQSPCPLVAVDFAGGEVDIDTPQDRAYLT